MTGIAVTLFVKNPNAQQHGQIHYHNIGDNLSRIEKLEKINGFASVACIREVGDWLNQHNYSFSKHIVLGDKR